MKGQIIKLVDKLFIASIPNIFKYLKENKKLIIEMRDIKNDKMKYLVNK